MQVSYKMIQNLIKLLIIVAAIILVVFILINRSNSNNLPGSSSGTNSSQSSGGNTSTTSDPYKILAPATVSPKVQECNQTITYSSNGVPAPLQCANGNLNVAAWNALSAQEPKLMSLGYSPSSSDVQSAVCSDINVAASDSAPGADNAIETGVFQISSLYYGWNLGSASNYVSKC